MPTPNETNEMRTIDGKRYVVNLTDDYPIIRCESLQDFPAESGENQLVNPTDPAIAELRKRIEQKDYLNPTIAIKAPWRHNEWANGSLNLSTGRFGWNSHFSRAFTIATRRRITNNPVICVVGKETGQMPNDLQSMERGVYSLSTERQWGWLAVIADPDQKQQKALAEWNGHWTGGIFVVLSTLDQAVGHWGKATANTRTLPSNQPWLLQLSAEFAQRAGLMMNDKSDAPSMTWLPGYDFGTIAGPYSTAIVAQPILRGLVGAFHRAFGYKLGQFTTSDEEVEACVRAEPAEGNPHAIPAEASQFSPLAWAFATAVQELPPLNDSNSLEYMDELAHYLQYILDCSAFTAGDPNHVASHRAESNQDAARKNLELFVAIRRAERALLARQ